MKRSVLIAIIALSFSLGIAAALWVGHKPQYGISVQSSGKALIGGSFDLVNGQGKTVADNDFAGKLMLVFFGFTHCPDICPTELQTVATALDALGPDAGKVAPLFISVDPERDNPETIGAYAASFDKRIIGLTGSQEQVARAAKAYRVYYRRAQPSENAAPQAYVIDHSAFIYLMNGKGEYITHFNFGVTPEKIAETIRTQLETDSTKATLG